jgi:hypothetical protein
MGPLLDGYIEGVSSTYRLFFEPYFADPYWSTFRA